MPIEGTHKIRHRLNMEVAEMGGKGEEDVEAREVWVGGEVV